MKTTRLNFARGVFVLLLALSLKGAAAQDADRVPSQQALSDWLRHQEGLVRSAECRFTDVRLPTAPEMIPHIREVCRIRGKEAEYANYVYTDELVKLQTSTTHWWRRGIQERIEARPVADADADLSWKPSTVTVFDGQVIRSLEQREESPIGAIKPASDWSSVNRANPFSFLYYFQDMPYSEIVAKAPDFQATTVDRSGAPHIKVTLRHPQFENRSFVFLFDADRRLIERDVNVKLSRDPAQRLYERHVFSDYRSYGDPSGEVIWFPQTAVYHYYLEKLPDGTIPEYSTRILKITEAAFNVDVPDEQFALDFPQNAKIYDSVSGLGWLDKEAERAHAEAIRPARATWRILVVVNLIALIAIGVAFAIWKTRMLRKR